MTLDGETVSISPRQLRLPRFPVRATYWLIGINCVVFAIDMLMQRQVTMYGALMPILVVQYQQWWRLLTAGFLHADILHIAFNLYAFHSLGLLMERFFGLRRFLATYGLSLVGCSVLVTLFSPPQTPTVGASGAIMGVLGAMVVFFWRYRDRLLGGQSFLDQLIRMALINIGIGLLPGISWWGHLGGFLAGAASGLVLLPRYQVPDWLTDQLTLRPLSERNWLGLAAIAGAQLTLLVLALLFRG